MSDFDKETFLEQFRELYEGVPQGGPTWFVSNPPGYGVFDSIETLTAEQASAKPCGSLSVAAHVEHLRWSLDFAMRFYRGELPSADWSSSWSVSEVDEDAWSSLKRALRSGYREVVEAVARNDDWSDRRLRAGTLALVIHGAYHLGVMRLLGKQVEADLALERARRPSQPRT